MREVRGRRSQEAPDSQPDNPDASPESVARTLILRSLNHSARTRHQLAEMLTKRLVPDEAATTALDRFEEVGLIDDAKFAQQWVEERHRCRGLSRSVLRQELRKKGVADELIDEALEQVSSEDEFAAAKELAERRVSKLSALDANTARRRLTSYLQRRGYSYQVISVVVEDVLVDLSDDAYSGV